jgi:prepilin peptidase CpaA
MHGVNILLLACTLFAAAAAYRDWQTGHIPNRLVLAGLLIGLALHLGVRVWLLRAPATGAAAELGAALVSAVLGVATCALVPLLLYRMEAIGGGDVKLLAVLGAFLGPLGGLEVELYSFIVIAVYAPARLAYQGQLLRLLSNSALIFVNPFLPKARRRSIGPELLTSLRFGPAVFAAAAIVTAVRWVTA